jgi:hypothetical protein
MLFFQKPKKDEEKTITEKAKAIAELMAGRDIIVETVQSNL